MKEFEYTVYDWTTSSSGTNWPHKTNVRTTGKTADTVARRELDVALKEAREVFRTDKSAGYSKGDKIIVSVTSTIESDDADWDQAEVAGRI